MKEVIFTFAALFGLISITNAQSSFGVNTSVGTSLARNETTASGQIFDYINHEVTFTGTNIAKSIGIFGQRKFGYLYGRAELSYANYSQEYTVRSFVQLNQGSQDVYENFQFIDFQVMAGLTKDNLRFGVGPVAHMLVGHTSALDFISGYSDNNRPVTFGFTTAVGVDAGRFSIDLRYINNFRTVGEHINYGTRNSGFKNKPHMVNLTVGFSII